MPFFDNEDWFGKTAHLWLWVALTIPATAGCFLYYNKMSPRLNEPSANDDISLESQSPP